MLTYYIYFKKLPDYLKETEMSGLFLNEVNNSLFHCDLVPNDPQIGVVPQTGVWGRLIYRVKHWSLQKRNTKLNGISKSFWGIDVKMPWNDAVRISLTLTLMPSNRDSALRGLKALSVLRDLMAPRSESPMALATRLTRDTWNTWTDVRGGTDRSHSVKR